jgi:hypothetical protein
VTIGGLSQAELSARWHQWLVFYPDGGNPAKDDTTGALSYLGGDQTPVAHPGVFYLAGNFGSPSTRAVTVSTSDVLFFPLITSVAPSPFYGNTEAELRAASAAELGTVSNAYARLNSVDLPLPPPTTSLLDFRQQSPPGLFDLVVPDNNVYGVPADTYQSISDGYFLALGPLSRGIYELEFGADASGTPPDFPGFSQDQSYVITVVPEPATVVPIGIGALGLIGCGRRRRTTAV